MAIISCRVIEENPTGYYEPIVRVLVKNEIGMYIQGAYTHRWLSHDPLPGFRQSALFIKQAKKRNLALPNIFWKHKHQKTQKIV